MLPVKRFFEGIRALIKHNGTEKSDLMYDYTNQAWVQDGFYLNCRHLGVCNCFGRLHHGEPVLPDADLH